MRTHTGENPMFVINMKNPSGVAFPLLCTTEHKMEFSDYGKAFSATSSPRKHDKPHQRKAL